MKKHILLLLFLFISAVSFGQIFSGGNSAGVYRTPTSAATYYEDL